MFLQFVVDCCRVFFMLILPMVTAVGIPFYFVWKRDMKKIDEARAALRRSKVAYLQPQIPPQQSEEPAVAQTVAVEAI